MLVHHLFGDLADPISPWDAHEELPITATDFRQFSVAKASPADQQQNENDIFSRNEMFVVGCSSCPCIVGPVKLFDLERSTEPLFGFGRGSPPTITIERPLTSSIISSIGGLVPALIMLRSALPEITRSLAVALKAFSSMAIYGPLVSRHATDSFCVLLVEEIIPMKEYSGFLIPERGRCDLFNTVHLQNATTFLVAVELLSLFLGHFVDERFGDVLFGTAYVVTDSSPSGLRSRK